MSIPSRNVALFEVVVDEPTIEQHCAITLSPRTEADEYIVKLTGIGHARPTIGMHRAVEAVGDWVAGLDERARVLERKLRGVNRMCYNSLSVSRQWPAYHLS